MKEDKKQNKKTHVNLRKEEKKKKRKRKNKQIHANAK